MRVLRVLSILLGCGVFASWVSPVSAELPNHPLIEKAKQDHRREVQYALDQGVQVQVSADGKSYYLYWFPEDSDPNNPPPVIASLHGHGGCAFVDFYVWQSFLKERGYGFLALQWWVGETEATEDYLRPEEIYRVLDQAFQIRHIRPGQAMLHGFSRGSANIYPVAVMDTRFKNYFSLFVANAGRANSGYPPVHEIEAGRFGSQPLAGSHWVTYAGAKDANPERDGVPGMRQTGEWIARYGGKVELAIEDVEGDHGGFHRRSENCNKALDVFDRVRVSYEDVNKKITEART